MARRANRVWGWVVVVTAVVCSASAGCAGLAGGGGPTDPAPAPIDAAAAGDASTPPRGRTQVWAENCMRCHNARPATYYSVAEWEVAMHHMHVRCGLTMQESRAVMEFFRASK